MLRLEEKPFELDGRTYQLRCNMATLDALEEAHDGDFAEVINMPARKGVLEILAAMLNEYADDQGWPERWTPAALKRRFSYQYLLDLDVLGIFYRAVVPQKDQGTPAPAENETNEGN